MSLSSGVFSSDKTNILCSQVLQIDQETDAAQDRMCALVGEVLVKIGENTQLLRFEQLELTKENIALKHQITQLKMIHVAEWGSVIESARAYMSRVCEKVKLIVEHFTNIDERLNKLSVDLERYSPSSEDFQLKGGCLSFHATYKERLKSIFSEWLENLSKVQFKEIENYPDYTNKQVTQLARENDADITSLGLVATVQSNEIVMRFAQPQIKKLKILETETVAMRALNAALVKEKESMAKEHIVNINSLKGVIKLFQPDEILKGLHEFIKPFEEISKGKIPNGSLVLHELFMKQYPDWKNKLFKAFFMGYAIDASLFIQKVKPLIAAVEEFQADFDPSKTKETK
jgi:hypothetical protein